ncbi:hypothetical protein PR048_007714 [Dryococelus australis]|uniref:Uncharacterized protein n=1 Tax=Dryococelus australis TaxID=614101 RepID=A0ABQ9HV12_9NEOP|nr:hypothetical protein PR048_007714 [Dryococelus australis]
MASGNSVVLFSPSQTAGCSPRPQDSLVFSMKVQWPLPFRAQLSPTAEGSKMRCLPFPNAGGRCYRHAIDQHETLSEPRDRCPITNPARALRVNPVPT